MLIRPILGGLLISVFCCLKAVAQQKYHVSLIDTETGLSQSTVYSMAKDSKGFVWFGAAQSLSRFDGSKIKNYVPQPIAPNSRMIQRIVEDSKGDLWLNVGDCLARFDFKTERFVPVKVRTATGVDFLRGWPLAVRGTTIWCISPTTQEVFSYNYQTHKKVVFLTKIPFLIDNDNFFNGSLYDQRSSLWLHLTEGVLRFDINTHQSQHFFSRHPHNRAGAATVFHSVSFHRDSVILANNSHGIAMLIDGSQHRVIKPLGAFNAIPNSIITLPEAHYDFVRDFGDGLIWIRRSFGVFKLSPLLPKFQKVTQTTHGAFDNEASVRSMVSLNDSIVRVGMSSSNYWYNRRTKIIQKAPKSYALSGVIGRPFQTQGGYWVATTKKGLAYYDSAKNKLSYFSNPDTLQPEDRFANILFKVVATSPTTLLVSSESGLFIFRKKTRTYHRIPYFGKQRGRYPFQDHTGRLYISNENLYVGRLRDTVWIPEKTLPLTHRFRNGFEDTLHQVIWGATTDGAKMISLRDWSVRRWTTKDGLNDDYIYDILVDKQGKVWMSTNRGISRLDLTTQKIDNFKLGDGLQSLEFNSNTAHIAPEGEFFFGGVRGFNHFYPEEVRFNTHLANPILTDFKVSEKPFKLSAQIGEVKKIELNATESTFSIDFSAIDHFSNGQNTFQYRLKGLDNRWIQANQQTTARFVQVPAGTYIFEVKAANSDGIWNNNPARLIIKVLPQLWETIWFRAIMLLLLIMGMYGLYRYRIYVVQEQQRKEMAVMVQTQEAERMRFAQDLHDGLGANLSAIKLVLGLIDQPEARIFKEKSMVLLNESLDDLRRLIHAMSPRSLERLGLVKALQEMGIIMQQTTSITVEISAYNVPEVLPEEMQINLFRIVQELFQNTLKHAQATQVTVELHGLPQELELHYTDNGRGFDTTQMVTAGNGLSNLQKRAYLLQATFELQSAPNEGMTVSVRVPYRL